jgi:hypothetical protein
LKHTYILFTFNLFFIYGQFHPKLEVNSGTKNENILHSSQHNMEPRYTREDNIRTDLKGTDLEGVDRIHLAKDRDQWWALGNMVMNIQVP